MSDVKFKVGDKVIMSACGLSEFMESDGGHPSFNPKDTPGVVERINEDVSYSISVKWENDQRNCYKPHHLTLVSIVQTIRPPHYIAGDYEPIKVIRAWELGFCLGNTLKYIARAGKKASEGADLTAAKISDLEKAKHYIELELKYLGAKE